jgi:uracil-DNA glycosylase
VNPLEALHPVIIAQMKYGNDPSTPVQRAKFRASIKRQVTGCTDCELHKQHAPVPYSRPVGGDPKFVVIGEAPGPKEAEAGEPFIGPAGKLFRALMREAGIDPEADVWWQNTVSCFPTNDGKVIRKPKPEERVACYDNCLMQAAASYTPYVLLVGATAFNMWRSDFNVTNNHGRIGVWQDSHVVMGCIHPASVLRGSSGYKKLIAEDLRRWRDIVYGDDNPLIFLDEDCWKCGAMAVMWDRDGIPYCTEHWNKWKHQWEKERGRWLQKIVQLTF